MNFPQKTFNLLFMLLFMLKIAQFQQANLSVMSTCSSPPTENLLQSGTYSLTNYRQSSTRQHNFQIVVNYNIPSYGFTIAVSTSRIDGYNQSQGTDYSILGFRLNNTNIASFMLFINNDLSWSTVRASFLISSRTDFFVGRINIQPYNLYASNDGSFIAKYVIPDWSPTQVSVSFVYLISGLRCSDNTFNLALSQGGFNTQTGQVSVRISSNAGPIIEMIYISYIVFYNTSPYTLNSYNPLLVVNPPQSTYFFEGINSINGNSITYQGYGINSISSTNSDSTTIPCIGGNCQSSCVTPLRCTSTNGVIYFNQCLMCSYDQVYSSGQCLSRCGINQTWSGVACECKGGLTRINGICASGVINCSVNQVYNSNQCICIAGYQRRNGICQLICPGSSYWNGLQCICVQGYVKVGDRCFYQCTANGYQADNGGCVCLNGFTRNTNGLCISACGVNEVYDITQGQCICKDGFLLYKSQCTAKCPGDFANAVIYNGICVCIQGFDAIGGRCIKQIICANPFQIVVNGRCTCQHGYQYNSLGLCVQACGLNEIINNSICQCVNGYSRNIQGVCTKLCPLNQIASGSACQCITGFTRTIQGVCVRTCGINEYVADNTCVCAPGYVRNPATNVCIRQCNVNQILSGDKCICIQGYIRNASGSCILQGTTCGQNQVLISNRCQCQDGFKRVNNICVSICRVTLNQIYDSPTKSCVCRDGYGIGSTSGTCQRCPLNSHSSGFLTGCICNDGYKWNQSTKKCQTITCPANRINVNGVCVCNTGYYEDSSTINSECKPIQTCPVRSVWVQSRLQCVCSVTNEFLINRTCQTCQNNSAWNGTDCVCRSGYFLNQGQCIQCNANAQYLRGNCVCNIGYFGNGTICAPCYQTCGTCSSPSADACLTCVNISYTLSNGVCTSRTCDSGYYRNISYNKCDKCLNYCTSCIGSNDCSQCIDGFNIQRISSFTAVSSITCIELCGDGKRITDQCDDGNTNNNDGCSSSCNVQNGWTCVGGTSTTRSQCLNTTPSASLILVGGHVVTQGVVYQGISMTYLPQSLSNGGCPNCDYILNVSVTNAQVIPIISVDYVTPTQYKFAIKFDFGGVTGLFAFTFTIRINSQFSPYFTLADMQQVRTITIDPATLAKVELLGELSLNNLQVDSTLSPTTTSISSSTTNIVIDNLPAEAVAILFPN